VRRIEDKLTGSVRGTLLAMALIGQGVALAAGNNAEPTATPIKHVVVIFGENI